MTATSGILIFVRKLPAMTQSEKKQEVDPVLLKMVYNNVGSSPGLQAAWGLSVWIASGSRHLLFDTGGDASILRENLHNARLDPALLSTVLLSHDHWDHRNGLDWLLGTTAFVPEVIVPDEVREAYATTFPAARIRGATDAMEIAPGIWTTGSLPTTYKGNPLYEQALVIVRNDRLYLITGCSHPGIGPIVEKVNQLFPGKSIALVAGGFHLGPVSREETGNLTEAFHREGVEKIAPSHCTGEEAIALFRQEWGDSFIEFYLGDELLLP